MSSKKVSAPKAGKFNPTGHGRPAKVVCVWVPWKPTAPNQLRYAHWTKTLRSKKEAQAAWRLMLLASPSDAACLTTTMRSPIP